MSKTPAERCSRIIRANRYLTLATCNGRTPWAAPIAYVTDDDLSFFFYSATASLNAVHIASNPVVSCAIFDSRSSSDDADGVQFSGSAFIVEYPELTTIVNLYFRKSFPDATVRARWNRPVEDFADGAKQRFFRIRPAELFVPDLASTKIDLRIPVSLNDVLHQMRDD